MPGVRPAPIIAPRRAAEDHPAALRAGRRPGQVDPAQRPQLHLRRPGRAAWRDPGSNAERGEGDRRGALDRLRPARLQPAGVPDSAALSEFLAKRSDSLRDKRLVVLAFAAPYYLDTTEISKLTAYFGVYAPYRAVPRDGGAGAVPRVHPCRVRRRSPSTGINYELINQLEPAPGQIISLSPVGSGDVISGSIQVGSQIELETGVILDRNGHPCPTARRSSSACATRPNRWRLRPRWRRRSAGRRARSLPLDRPGELWITAAVGRSEEFDPHRAARSAATRRAASRRSFPRRRLRRRHEPHGHRRPPTATATPDARADAKRRLPPWPRSPPPPKPRVAFGAFFAALLGAVLAGGRGVHARAGAASP